MQRCPWCEGFDLYREYHDTEWGVPLRDDRALFELINLEGAQAGLSWSTVLKKRETYRLAFDQFDPEKSPATMNTKWPNCWPTLALCATASKWPPPSPMRRLF